MLGITENLPKDVKQLYPFQSHYLEMKDEHKGTWLYHYIDEGPKEAPVLLLLHGNPTWSFYYREVIKSFSDRFRVICPDHLGMGASESFKGDSVKGHVTVVDHIDHLHLLLSHLGVKDLNMMVHDWGGAIGVGLLAKYKEHYHLQKLVVTNTAAFRSKNIPKRIALCKLPALGPFLVQNCNAFAYLATKMATAKGLSSTSKKALLLPFPDRRSRKAVFDFVKDIPLHREHPSYDMLKEEEDFIVKHLKDEQVLILWGAKDFCFDLSFYERWSEFFPKARKKVYPKAGHYLLEDESDSVINEVQAFL